MTVNDSLEVAVQRLQAAGVRTVYGEPVASNGRTIVPVARVAYAFGYGGGTTNTGPDVHGPIGHGAGGGGAVRAVPAGVLEITAGRTRFLRFSGWRPQAATALAGFVLGVVCTRLAIGGRT